MLYNQPHKHRVSRPCLPLAPKMLVASLGAFFHQLPVAAISASSKNFCNETPRNLAACLIFASSLDVARNKICFGFFNPFIGFREQRNFVLGVYDNTVVCC